MSKGSKQRPTVHVDYASNYDRIFGKKYIVPEEQAELEKCPYCGIMTDNPCDSVPPDICEQAINVVHGELVL